jgi:hypothetical protein
MTPDSQTPGNVEPQAPVCRRDPIVIEIIGASSRMFSLLIDRTLPHPSTSAPGSSSYPA